MWTKFKSMPVYRDALRIENPAYLCCESNPDIYIYDNGDGTAIRFKVHKTPRAGDYIVKESDTDIYLVTQEVFMRKYSLA